MISDVILTVTICCLTATKDHLCGDTQNTAGHFPKHYGKLSKENCDAFLTVELFSY